MFIKYDEDGYIIVASSTPVIDGVQEEINLPIDFNFAIQDCYRFVDGVVTLDVEKLQQRLSEDQQAVRDEERQRQWQQDTIAVASIVFVSMAQSGQLDDVTITEHPVQFPTWDGNWRGVAGSIVRNDGGLYRAIHDIVDAGQNRKPSETASMWTRIGDPAEEWPEWSQPIGAHDAYAVGDKVSFGGKYWISELNGNVWKPGVYGWIQVEA